MREKERSDELARVQLARASSYTQAHVFFVRQLIETTDNTVLVLPFCPPYCVISAFHDMERPSHRPHLLIRKKACCRGSANIMLQQSSKIINLIKGCSIWSSTEHTHSLSHSVSLSVCHLWKTFLWVISSHILTFFQFWSLRLICEAQSSFYDYNKDEQFCHYSCVKHYK